jgi:hypothetical protein
MSFYLANVFVKDHLTLLNGKRLMFAIATMLTLFACTSIQCLHQVWTLFVVVQIPFAVFSGTLPRYFYPLSAEEIHATLWTPNGKLRR